MRTAPEILQKDAPILRKTAEAVALSDISTPEIGEVLSKMKSALETQKDGVALAGPQVGFDLRIFIVSEKAYQETDDDGNVFDTKKTKPTVFINPEIIKRSRKKRWMEEGCLSVRPLYGKTHRSEKTLVRAYDENGEMFTHGGSGLLSQIFQHEIDHLNGILFIDHATGLHTIEEKERTKE